MARKTTARSGANAWQWSRTAETRRIMLRAAREVFGEQGFADASVADVVDRAGSSVGSLYHHFGGKAELFLALWEDHQRTQENRAATAVAKARAAHEERPAAETAETAETADGEAARGEADPLELFVTGARAFLEDTWERRDLVRLFMDGDGPPGFELMRRTRAREWVRQNAVLLGASADPVDRVTVAVLTTIIGEASREIASCATKDEADTVTEATIRLIHRLDPLSPA